MRKLSLKTYCQYYLKKLSKNKTLDIRELDQELQTENIRLYVPLLVYCFLMHRSVPTTSRLFTELESMRLQNIVEEEESVLLYLESTNEYEHLRFVRSFRAENKRRDDSEMKELSRQVILLYQKQYNLSIYKI